MIEILTKLNFLITKRHRRGLFHLTLLLFFGMILEIFGLAIIVPTISSILDPDSLESNKFLILIKEFFGVKSNIHFKYFFLLSVVFIYIIKTLFFILLAYKQSQILNKISTYISNSLFSNYLKQTYSFHLKKDSSKIIKTLQVEINLLSAFLVAIITFVIESSLSVSILITLFYIELTGAISIGVFFLGVSYFFFTVTKNKIKFWGLEREIIDNQNSKISVEAIGGIKEITLYGKQNFFIQLFQKNNFRKQIINTYQNTIIQVPRFFLELVTIIGLTGFIAILIYRELDTTSLISILGVFVTASFRMIPSLNRIIASLQQIKFYRPSLDTVFEEYSGFENELSNNQESLNDKFKLKNTICLKDVSFKYEKSDKIILDKISFDINKGECIGIIGESGSGKSTLIDIIVGLYSPVKGKIEVDNININLILSQWKGSIGYIPQSIFLLNDTILNNIAFGISENDINMKRVKSAINKAQLDQFVNSLPKTIQTNVGERGIQLSGGQKQRIGIARALYNDPDILILDEATSSLDTETEIEVMNSINKLKGLKTLILVAHRISTLENCDKIYKIKNGNISSLVSEKIND